MHHHFRSHLLCKGTFGHPIPPVKARGVRAVLSSPFAHYGLCGSKFKKPSRRKRRTQPLTLVSFMYLVYQTMVHSLQSNPLHHQASGDPGCSSCGAEAVGAALALDSFLFLLYFPVRLYFPLVPDDTGQKPVVGNRKQNYLSSAWPVLRVPVYSRNPCRWMNIAEAGGHATPSSVDSGEPRGLRDEK